MDYKVDLHKYRLKNLKELKLPYEEEVFTPLDI